MSLLQFGTTVQFANGARRTLGDGLAQCGVTRPLCVTDQGVITAGVFDQALTTLDRSSLAVFDQVPPNPTEAAAAAGAAAFHQHGCDGIIGIGGGATLDLAKAIALLTRNAPPLWDYCNRHAAPRAIVNAPPLILLPTTAGTGSEVGRSAVIVFDNGIKAGVRCPDIVTLALCDPELTLTLPPVITASTGMDALAHCIETFCSPVINPPAEAIALDGMQRIFLHLPRAVANGQDLDARWHMMMGSLEGALCFQKGLGAVHALAHPLGALGFHHGTLNAIFLPHVMRFNLPALAGGIDDGNADAGGKAGHGNATSKAARMCQQAGLPPHANFADALAQLLAQLPLPARLRDLGVTRAQLAGIPAGALADNAHKTNPRALLESDYQTLLDAAY